MKKRQRTRFTMIFISFLLFPVTMFYLSPALIIIGAARGVVTGSLIAFGAMFAVSLVAGRAFCGWICPGAGIQEACFMIQEKPVRKGNWIKYLIWVPWISVILAMFVIHGLNEVDPLFGIKYGISMGEPQNYIIFYFFLALFMILSIAVGRRSFCHHVCWMAPFMVLGRKARNLFAWPSLKLKAKPAVCRQCHLCDRHCPMSLGVESMVLKGDMENSECILCGSCIDHCNAGAVRYGFFR